MFRRRAKATEATSDTTPSDTSGADVDAEGGDPEAPTDTGAGDDGAAAGPTKPARANGPWDVSELDDRPAHTAPRLDLGGLRIRPPAGTRLQIQVDKATGTATSVLILSDQGGLQLMATAASKTKPLWPPTMATMRADADRRRAQVQEGEGPWGPVLRMTVPANTSDGKSGVQPSVVFGIDGPRWMLRATVLGKAAVDQDGMNMMMAVVQDAIVVRGDGPMAPGEVLPLTPPPTTGAGGPAGAEPGGAEQGGAESGGAESTPAEPGDAESEPPSPTSSGG